MILRRLDSIIQSPWCYEVPESIQILSATCVDSVLHPIEPMAFRLTLTGAF